MLILPPARIAKIQALQTANDPRWQTCLNAARGTNAEVSVWCAPLVAAINQDGTMARKAVDTFTAQYLDFDPAFDDYINSDWWMPCASLILDWCKPWMSATEIQQYADRLMYWCDRIWNRTPPDTWAIDPPLPWNNYWWKYIRGTAMAGSACFDIHAYAPIWLAMVVDYYKKLSLPYFEGEMRAGFWYDGNTYGSTERLAMFLDATGEPVPEFLSNTTLFQIHTTMPSRDRRWCWGDQPGGLGLSGGDQEKMLLAIAMTTDEERKSYGRYWLKNCKFGSAPRPHVPVLYVDDGPVADYRTSLPLDYHAGVLYLSRAGWNDDAVMYSVECSPLRDDHLPDACGNLLIARGGDYLLGNASLWSDSQVLSDSHNHNVLTCLLPTDPDPSYAWEDAHKYSGQATGRIGNKILTVGEVGPLRYFDCQFGDAYNVDATRLPGGMKDAVRRWIVGRHDTWACIERVTCNDPSLDVLDHWHFLDQSSQIALSWDDVKNVTGEQLTLKNNFTEPSSYLVRSRHGQGVFETFLTLMPTPAARVTINPDGTMTVHYDGQDYLIEEPLPPEQNLSTGGPIPPMPVTLPFSIDCGAPTGDPAYSSGAAGYDPANPGQPYGSAPGDDNVRYWPSGDGEYIIDPPQGGTYDVPLRFKEVYPPALGNRKFHVELNGTRVLDTYSPPASVEVKTFPVTVTVGQQIRISLKRIAGNGDPAINGIGPVDLAGTPPPPSGWAQQAIDKLNAAKDKNDEAKALNDEAIALIEANTT